MASVSIKAMSNASPDELAKQKVSKGKRRSSLKRDPDGDWNSDAYDSQLDEPFGESVPYRPTPISRRSRSPATKRSSIERLQSDTADIASTQDGCDQVSSTDECNKIFSSDDGGDITVENFESMDHDVLLTQVSQAKTATEIRARNILLARNRFDLFIQVWVNENGGKECLRGWQDSSCLEIALEHIFLTTPRVVTDAIFHGDLPRKSRLAANGKLRRALIRVSRQALARDIKQPCIYAHFLVNKCHGLGPTWEELIQVVRALKTYVDDYKFANAVDNIINPMEQGTSMIHSKSGVRRYLIKSQTDLSTDERRLQDLNIFRDALHERLDTRSKQANYNPQEHMPEPLCEYGYTVDAADRRVQHQTHVDSNALMNLVDAVCRKLFNTKYTMEFYVVYCIPGSPLVGLAENLFSSLGLSSHRGGTGFNTVAAGNNLASNSFTAEQTRAHQQFVEREVNVDANSTAFIRRPLQFLRVGENLVLERTLQIEKERLAKAVRRQIRREVTERIEEHKAVLLKVLEDMRDDLLDELKTRYNEHIVFDSQPDEMDTGYEGDTED